MWILLIIILSSLESKIALGGAEDWDPYKPKVPVFEAPRLPAPPFSQERYPFLHQQPTNPSGSLLSSPPYHQPLVPRPQTHQYDLTTRLPQYLDPVPAINTFRHAIRTQGIPCPINIRTDPPPAPCQRLMSDINSFFVSTRNTKRDIEERIEKNICTFLTKSIDKKESLKSIITDNKILHIPAMTSPYPQVDAVAIPIGVSYRIDKDDLCIDFHAGALNSSETPFLKDTLQEGAYKSPHKVITYNVTKKKFFQGVVYPQQSDWENYVSHIMYPDIYKRQADVRIINNTFNTTTKYNYAQHVGLDLHITLRNPSSGLSTNQSLKIGFFNNLCNEITRLHAMGIRHNDLKLSNILVDRNNFPVVADFGFARETSDDDLKLLDTIGGTQGYIKPLAGSHCNYIKRKIDIPICLSIRKSWCIDLYALEQIRVNLGVTNSRPELSANLTYCNRWIDDLFSQDPVTRSSAQNFIPGINTTKK